MKMVIADRIEVLPDYVNAIEEKVCKPLHLPYCNNYYEMGINKYNTSLWFQDHSHPNTKGRLLLAKLIAKYLLGM